MDIETQLIFVFNLVSILNEHSEHREEKWEKMCPLVLNDRPAGRPKRSRD